MAMEGLIHQNFSYCTTHPSTLKQKTKNHQTFSLKSTETTTMHKPQWHARRAREDEGFKRWIKPTYVSVHSLPARTTLKLRQPGQSSRDEMRTRDLKKELLERESRHRRDEGGELAIGGPSDAVAAIEGPRYGHDDDEREKRRLDERGEDDEDEVESKRPRFDEDEDDELADSDDDSNDSDDDSDSDDDDEDDDDDEELMRELARIKQERQQQEALQAEQQRTQEQLTGNPLLLGDDDFDDDLTSVATSSATVKRKWNEDTIFRNQARDEVQPKKRFINDTLRSDFHRKFLQKYIK